MILVGVCEKLEIVEDEVVGFVLYSCYSFVEGFEGFVIILLGLIDSCSLVYYFDLSFWMSLCR